MEEGGALALPCCTAPGHAKGKTLFNKTTQTKKTTGSPARPLPGRPAAAPLSRVFPPLTAVGGFGCSVASLTRSPPHQGLHGASRCRVAPVRAAVLEWAQPLHGAMGCCWLCATRQAPGFWPFRQWVGPPAWVTGGRGAPRGCPGRGGWGGQGGRPGWCPWRAWGWGQPPARRGWRGAVATTHHLGPGGGGIPSRPFG